MAKPNTKGWDDIELLAVLDGIKPALRISLAPNQCETAIARYESLGLAVSVGTLMATYDGVFCHHLYVAPDPSTAIAIKDIEARIYKARHRSREGVEARKEIGKMLGYPDCCSKTFGHQHELSYKRLGWSTWLRWWLRSLGGPSDAFLCAFNGWVANPHPLLNIFRSGDGAQLISFSPCSLRCPDALALAESHLQLLRASNPERARAIYDLLREPLVVGYQGARVGITIDRVGPTAAIGEATPIAESYNRPPSAAAMRLASRTRQSKLLLDGGPMGGLRPFIALDFSAGDPGTPSP